MQRLANVLVVEDSYIIATRLQNRLEETLKVGKTFHAPTLASAHEIFLTNQIDLVILDISLPDGNGLDLLGWIKERKKDLCVIVLSNHAGVVHREIAKNKGVDYFLDKSLDFDKLIPIIESLIYDAGGLNGETSALQ